MPDDRKPAAFVPLRAVTAGRPDAAAALAELRQIYFKTSRRTIDNDFAHAVELLKSLPDEDTRARAHVYMEGLAEMAREWGDKWKSGKVEKWKSGKVEKWKSGKVRRKRRKTETP